MKPHPVPLMLLIVAICYSLFLQACHPGVQKAVVTGSNPAPPVQIPYFLFLSDVHLNVDADATCMGDDTGMDLWKKCRQRLQPIIDSTIPPRFILYTGDLPVHYDCKSCGSNCALSSCPNSLKRQHKGSIRTLLAALGQLAKAKQIPVLYAPGNNDALAGNYYPFSGAGYATPFSLVNQDATSDYPYQLFNIDRSATGARAYMLTGSDVPSGYWAIQLKDSLQVICLNTVMWGPKFPGVDSNQHRKMGDIQMNWLQQQLKAAQTSHNKVYLAMHIPPGIDAYVSKPMWKEWQDAADPRSWKNDFLGLMEQYDTTVSGIFYGHTHYDELRLLYNRNGTAIIKTAISCPGISTEHKNNPGFKLVQFEQASKAPVNFITDYTVPDCSNLAGSGWGNRNYSFSEVFGSKPGMSVYNTLIRMPVTDIRQKMALIYRVKNGQDTAGNKSLLVNW